MIKDQLWNLAKAYNELSHHYSNIADIFTTLAQKMEEEDETK